MIRDDLARVIAPARLILDPLRLLAYGTDASFYRLVPKVVVKAETEDEVRAVLAVCARRGAPVTFRASGTSLSGQAITDSVLLTLGDGWTRSETAADGSWIRLQPGIIGAEANRRLAAFARKIGPDPASIDSARIGGIAANNASGMCCGTAENSYRTLLSMRLILADGTLVDTGDAASVAAFRVSHGALLGALARMGEAVRADAVLAKRIADKFAIKNTTGYALNALVDHEDPVEILQHLMIGSEGTLGFIAEITYRTVPDYATRASALILFADMGAACRAVAVLKTQPVAAVELMDRAALASVQDKPGMPADLAGLPAGAAALLVEVRGEDGADLGGRVDAVTAALAGAATLSGVAFSTDPAECAGLWKIRKGLFPAVGAVRAAGTTVIIEDVAVRVADLAEAMADLQALFAKHGYTEAIIFGHALEGNVHFVFTQDFGPEAERRRYGAFMDEVCHLIVDKYDGSLKAEHGTGRNMAPFVALEWGAQAHGLMRRIKDLLDPAGLLNPGVILTDDADAHLKNLKPMPATDPLVDTCIECGFCEKMCPSHGLTLSPRQRIVGWREITRAGRAGERGRAQELARLYDYQGIDTCAACGLCASACPVSIDSGRFIRALRGRAAGPRARRVAATIATHFAGAMAGLRLGLGAVSALGTVIGADRVAFLGAGAWRLGRGRLPRLGAALPGPARSRLTPRRSEGAVTVVYVPSCVSRTMGPSLDDPVKACLPDAMSALLTKAGIGFVVPQGLDSLCCGQPWDSRGMTDIADAKAEEMIAALLAASDNGRLVVVMDTATCSARLKTKAAGRLTVLDSVEFAHDLVLPRLDLTPLPGPVLLHVPCSVRKMGLEGKLVALAQACCTRVEMPPDVLCCGFAGDKGFSRPELNDHALRHLRVPEGCHEGFSANRTCEIGLAEHAGVPYRSIIHLIDRVSRPRQG